MGKRSETADPETFFWKRVDRDRGDCWIWTGPVQSFGYGDMRVPPVPRRRWLAHRFSYELHYGPTVDGLEVLHRCDNPPCVRPDHLFLGTQADNMADKVMKGRQAKRSRNGAAKLTEAQYEAILRRASEGDRPTDIAAAFGVTIQAVSQFVKRNRPLVTER